MEGAKSIVGRISGKVPFEFQVEKSRSDGDNGDKEHSCFCFNECGVSYSRNKHTRQLLTSTAAVTVPVTEGKR